MQLKGLKHFGSRIFTMLLNVGQNMAHSNSGLLSKSEKIEVKNNRLNKKVKNKKMCRKNLLLDSFFIKTLVTQQPFTILPRKLLGKMVTQIPFFYSY